MSRQTQRNLGQRPANDGAVTTTTYDDEIESSQPSNPQADRLGDARDANERTALLGSSTSRDYRTEAARDRAALAEAGHPELRPRPWSLKFDLAVAFALLLANGYFLVTSLISFNTPFVANTGLPPHRGSLGLPVWSSFLGCTLNSAALFSFVFPHESPLLAFYTAVATAIFALVTLILSVSVTQLRVVEGPLSFVTISLLIVSALHAALSAALTDRYAPILDPPAELDPDYEPEVGCWASCQRGVRSLLGFLGISLPLAAAHVGVMAAAILLMINVIIRSIDASVEQPGQRWKVEPWLWSRQFFPELNRGLLQSKGREYRVHLACRGVGLEDPPSFAATAAPVNSTITPLERGSVRRTILVEGERGMPANYDADWVLRMLKDGDLNSGDVEIRVCYWDRPGYGFSDASSTSAGPHVVSALTQALTVSGEMARLQPPPGLESAQEDSLATEGIRPPSPLARSGFILVSRGHATGITSLFAAIHPRLVHSFLYLSPVSPATHDLSPPRSRFLAVPHFFTRTLPAIYTELGVGRLWSTLKGVPRRRRVFAYAGEHISGLIERAAVQEQHEDERGRESDAARAWERRRGRYPTRPTVVLGHGAEGDGGKKFVEDVVGDGLQEWDPKWNGGKTGCGKGGDVEKKCREAIKSLLHLD
ncbi:hypothetical protein JCM3774_001043 [Rhodotorula dairenensis]